MAEFSLGEALLGTGIDLSGLQKGISDAESEAKSGFVRIGDVLNGAAPGVDYAVLLALAALATAAAAAGFTRRDLTH